MDCTCNNQHQAQLPCKDFDQGNILFPVLDAVGALRFAQKALRQEMSLS